MVNPGPGGVVVIGRNEGQRLRQSLLSLRYHAGPVVYVDSGSQDGSLDLARSLGVNAISLEAQTPFTAARARNAGFACVLHQWPGLNWVQFVDGDCEVAGGWLERGAQGLAVWADVAVVVGHQQELYPQQSIYHRLMAMEWDHPVGEIQACGGNALVRATAFHSVGGFNPDLIAGEDPELSLRLRHQGWKIVRIDAEMTRHDGQMRCFSQWWRRSVRAGHAYAEVAWLHRRGPEQFWRHANQSNWLWGAAAPLSILGLLRPTRGGSLSLALPYLWLWRRIFARMRQRGYTPADAALYAGFCILGKFPQAWGQMQFHLKRLLGAPSRIIEYK